MIDRIKNDIAFRNKTILILLVVVIAVSIVMMTVTSSEDNRKDNLVIDKTGSVNLIPADTTSLNDDKMAIYREDKMFQDRENRTIDLVNNEANFGLSPQEIAKKEEEQMNDIDAYMAERRKQTERAAIQSEKNRMAQQDYVTANQTPNDATPVQQNKPPKKEKTKEELEAEYYQTLLKAKEERMGIKQEEKNLFEFRAVFYLDQWVIPGDRARLILPKDVVINNRVFPKGTDLYANVSISKSRVIFKITNINHYPIEMMVKDLQDGEIGIYSEQAGKLWRDYQADLQQHALNQVGQEIQRDLNLPLLSAGITSLKAFFSRKRYANNERILLLNDHEVIITNNFDQEEFKDVIN
ncbi:conjugative transposon protein TraM (plasmid) [Capnocytophaga canis]|uniref:conjugative transposon protein TraM n=1 Tax=Capnocytophaga canis TaxID=1848903 RepID=UPI00370D974C